MVFGYTPFDPLVVLWGTVLAMWYLQKSPVKLIGFMPTALSLWFFVPIVTNLTLWQTVPLLLIGRIILLGRLHVPKRLHPVIFILVLTFALSAGYALIAGRDDVRAVIRIVYYSGVLAIFAFAYEMGRRHDAYEIFLKGLVVMGIIYAVYGGYQIVAFYTGLPVRGIVYSAGSNGVMAFESGILRINSLANEPKRLGYVLLVSAIACVFLARLRPARRARQLRWAAAGILVISFLTFAGSYFLAIVLFGLSALVLYPSRASVYIFGALVIVIGASFLVPDLSILEVVQRGFVRRTAELGRGLDGAVVYRQELFAWDYLANNPLTYLTGVGVGQYFSVLNRTYGVGAGYDALGALTPMNSNFLELVFDLGVIGAVLIYGGLVILIFKLRRAGETFFCLSLLFLLVQSLTILTLLYMVLFAGMALGRLAFRRDEHLKTLSQTSEPVSAMPLVARNGGVGPAVQRSGPI